LRGRGRYLIFRFAGGGFYAILGCHVLHVF
jgi:hypothetical protein